MTTNNATDYDIVSGTNTGNDETIGPSAAEEAGVVPEDLDDSVPEAAKIVFEARRVELEAEAVADEAVQYEQDMQQTLLSCAAPSAPADSDALGDAGAAPDNSGQGHEPIVTGGVSKTADEAAGSAHAVAGQAAEADKHNFATFFKKATNMGSETPEKPELVDQILSGSAGIKAAEKAIQSALEAFMDAATNEVSSLVKNNTLYPEIREDMLKLEKRVMEMTLEAIGSIQARVPEQPKPKGKGGS